MASFAISQQPSPWPTASSPHPHCKEDQNKERDLFFTRLLLWPNDITSAASSPQIPAAQHIFPFRRRPSILFEFHHFIPILKEGSLKMPDFVFFLFVCVCVYAASLFSATRTRSESIQKINETLKVMFHIKKKNRKQLI